MKKWRWLIVIVGAAIVYSIVDREINKFMDRPGIPG